MCHTAMSSKKHSSLVVMSLYNSLVIRYLNEVNLYLLKIFKSTTLYRICACLADARIFLCSY